MTDSLTIAVAQMKSTAADLAGNRDKILAYLQEAEAMGADLLMLPEACLVGYPCGDIANRPNFLKLCATEVDTIIKATHGKKCALLFGALSDNDASDEKVPHPMPYNSGFLAEDGKLVALQHKACLPNFDVFHEKRHFASGDLPSPIEFRGIKLGLLICNDMWYAAPPSKLAEQGAEILLVSNGSPYHAMGLYNDDKLSQRMASAKMRTDELGLPILFVNAEGGQDDLLFDGQSFALNGDGKLAGLLPPFDNDLHMLRFEKTKSGGWHCAEAPMAEKPADDALLYQALVVGLRDYMQKHGFSEALLGLSGGIDSALVACLAVDALGAERVSAVRMPSEFSSQGSLTDAEALAQNLGITCETLSIESLRQNFTSLMQDYKDKTGIAGENIQARLRGNILMYIANASGKLLLATGNKSELAMGYATLYGDMCGGFAPIKDVYKTRVFALARHRNGIGEVIPENILTKAPSAELRPDQKDEDNLPPYDKLDAMLEFLLENNGKRENLGKARGGASFTEAEADEIWRRVMAAEHKRAQGAVGTRVTAKGFGIGWRYPITHGYKSEVS